MTPQCPKGLELVGEIIAAAAVFAVPLILLLIGAAFGG